jgi:hypothetical protein
LRLGILIAVIQCCALACQLVQPTCAREREPVTMLAGRSVAGTPMLDTINAKHLVLSPLASHLPNETHAALVVSQAAFADVRFAAGVQTVQQLRTGSAPNPWESAWAVFDYTDNAHFYYVAFKPNGWELGKVDPAYSGGQRFLASGSSPSFAIGDEHSFDITQHGNTIAVSIDGVLVTTFTDSERPYLSGKVGFYTEDATAAFDNVTGSINDTFEALPLSSLTEGATFGQWEVPFLGFGTGGIVTDSAGAQPTGPTAEPEARPEHINLFDLYRSMEPSVTQTGSSSKDVLNGTAGRDLLDGLGGADRMAGGTGDDTYKVNTSGDIVVERAWEGIDTVLSTASSFTLSSNVENLTLVGAGRQTGIGNEGGNVLISNAAEGVLLGNGGHDILISNRGADIMTGGSQSDTFMFNVAATSGGIRHIVDFQVGVDKIDLSAVMTLYLGPNPFADGHILLQANGQGGTNVVIDLDGPGAAAGVLVTAIDGLSPASLSHADFYWA